MPGKCKYLAGQRLPSETCLNVSNFLDLYGGDVLPDKKTNSDKNNTTPGGVANSPANDRYTLVPPSASKRGNLRL